DQGSQQRPHHGSFFPRRPFRSRADLTEKGADLPCLERPDGRPARRRPLREIPPMRSAFRLMPALLLLMLAPQLRAAEPRVAASLQPFVDKGTLAGAVVLVASPDKVLTVET